jgi:quercetin dioxygenase-like cupin family protein
MESASVTRTVVCLSLLLACSRVGAQTPEGGQQVETRGQESRIKLEAVLAGHLTELNGKYKLRASEVTYQPGGFIGSHHHAGPGIRCVTAGELTYIQPDKTSVFRPGDCFFESGDVSHTAENRTDRPVALLNFEILPATRSGASAISVPK